MQRTVPHLPAERKWPSLTSGVAGGVGVGGKDHRSVGLGTMWYSAYHLARFKINSREEADRALAGRGGGCSRTQPRTEDTGWNCQCGWRRSRMLHSREKAEGQLLLTLRRSQARTSLPGLNLRPCRGLSLFRRVPLFVTPWTVAHQLLCPWDSLQEYWSGWHALLPGSFLIQGWNAGLLHCQAGS